MWRKWIASTGMKMHFILCMGCVLSLVCLITTLGDCYAKGRVKPEWIMPDYYPDGFDGMGRINLIKMEDGIVVIDEDSKNLSLYVKCHTPTQKDLSIYLFKKGDLVGYMLNSEREIISIWLIQME